jgi:two-component system, NtrC family, sensor kinase
MKRVLVVDDSLTVRMDISDALEAAGFEAVGCASLEAASEATGRGADLVILDVLLPDGDGLAYLKSLRASPATARIPVILLSTEAEVWNRLRGIGAGADEYVGKPYDIAQVVARARALTHSIERRPAASNRRLLIVDDSVTFRRQLAETLAAAGYEVHEADSGEAALTLAADLRPDAVVVDGMLPGIDGVTVVRRLKSDGALRSTPCVLLTGAEGTAEELRSLEAGADAYVHKSEDLGVILARLAALLRSATSNARDASPSLLSPKRLLAIDDSETHLRALSTELGTEGYDVVLAVSGQEAIALLGAQSVDCILLDFEMPGMSGQETCRRIKQSTAWRDIPLVMLSARDDRNTIIECINAGADDFVTKSADLDVLKARVRAQLRKKHFEDETRRTREEEQIRTYAAALEGANRELESFSYSVAHDLRAPLRSIDGFSQALLDEYADRLDDEGRQYLQFVRESAQRMALLIDDLLALSRVTRAELRRESVDLGAIARATVARLERDNPDRRVEVTIPEGLRAEADPRLVGVVFDNLLGNAWKFTSKTDGARIWLGTLPSDSPRTYFVRDNGAGFDMNFAHKLFGVFQRLHSTSEFDGTGIGLAIVNRIVNRHGGRVWAEGEVGKGATFYFTLDNSLQAPSPSDGTGPSSVKSQDPPRGPRS